ncbi:ubiquitin-like protein 5 [Sorex fumeus]|uniref:ubiquitin-like protein 5 n=1 Tax=Sorex fumeus TaxID=62283 RepID=UPI0024AE78B4|nr:ubiquitin-like protein 5 [Sorex fumeus]
MGPTNITKRDQLDQWLRIIEAAPGFRILEDSACFCQCDVWIPSFQIGSSPCSGCTKHLTEAISRVIEVVCDNYLGKKNKKKKCNTNDTIEDPKKLIVAEIGTFWNKITLKKGCMIFNDHVSPGHYEIHDEMNLEFYYQ